MTIVNIPLDSNDASIMLSLLQKLNDSALERRRHAAQSKGKDWPPPKLPAVECKPWCEDGDGHPDCYGASDQACWSPSDDYVELSLEPVITECSSRFPHRIGVNARQEPGRGVVHIHLDGIHLGGPIPHPWDVLDHGLDLDPEEARRLGGWLLSAAGLIDGTAQT